MEPTLITLNKENLIIEHICCAISDKKGGDPGIAAKKSWLSERMDDGLTFIKLDARGKVFIEYIPAENAWMPVDAPGYTLINCHWVSGSFKGKGYGKLLLDACEKNVALSNGVIVVVGSKKKPYLSDKAFYLKHGYEVCDAAAPYFELMVKRFNVAAPLPRFNDHVKTDKQHGITGIDIYYTAQCPFTHKYINLIKPVAEASAVPVRIYQIQTNEQAQSHYCPVTTYSIFIDGKYYSNEILTPTKLEKLIGSYK